MSSEAVRAIVRAAAFDGFNPEFAANGLTLIGELQSAGRSYQTRIEFDSLALIHPPRFQLRDPAKLPRPVTPHVDEGGEICVVDRSRFVFDRYHAPEQLRGLIVRAREILANANGKAATVEIAREFPRYWSDRYRNLGPVEQNTTYLDTAQLLSFGEQQARPQNLGELLDWAAAWDQALPVAMLGAFAGLRADDPSVVIGAPNGTIIAQLLVSKRGSALLNALARREGWQRYIRTRDARSLEISRLTGRRWDMEAVLALNGKPLAGKAIVIVGCGAIGGYLVRMLIQLGAGFEGGRLLLVDDDKLEPANIRRHALGMDQIDRAKAEACAKAACEHFPGASITVRTARVETQHMILDAADLVVDVTGEQALSEWMNEWALQQRRAGLAAPTILHGWVAGEGAAAQSFISSDSSFGCYRCLQPSHSERPRYDPLREPVHEPMAACGDVASLPYGPQAPVHAAALVAGHAADWASGKPRPLLRTVRVNWEATVKRDPVNPSRALNCPACAA